MLTNTLFPKQYPPAPTHTHKAGTCYHDGILRCTLWPWSLEGLGLWKGVRLLAKRLLFLPLQPSLQKPPLEGNRLFCRNCLDTWGTSDSDFVASHCNLFWLLSLALISFLSSKLTGSRQSGVYFQELFTMVDGSVLWSVSQLQNFHELTKAHETS